MLDFEGESLYFNEPLETRTSELLEEAAESYGENGAEHSLLQAYFFEPEHPMVLVALYRYYYYQHRFKEALLVADRVLKILAVRLNFPSDWHELNEKDLGYGVLVSMTLIRFYMQALKGAGYLELRLGKIELALERLEKVSELDTSDRLGAKDLIKVAQTALEQKAGQRLSA